MPSWKQILDENTEIGGAADVTRRKYLKQLSEKTGRNSIAYYSAWLQKADFQRQGISGFEVNDTDKHGLMSCIHKMDRAKGLDLVLHTPGGSMAATESIIDYLRKMFGTNVRAIVPQLAMSAGTMIALSCKEILMGKHSNLGPIDPQVAGIAAHGVIEEFNQARADIMLNPALAGLWGAILSRYSPTLIGESQKAIDWAEQMVKQWLETGMFEGDADAKIKSEKVFQELGSHALTKSHSRHISMEQAADAGLKVISLEADQELQDLVLTTHHAFTQTLVSTAAVKVIENQDGIAYINAIQYRPMPQ